MAIKVITDKVEMPKSNECKFRYTCNNGNIDSYWYVYDRDDEETKLRKGSFKDMAFLCHQLNKNFYTAHPYKIVGEQIDKLGVLKPKGDWVFERSSGYAGYRCVVCQTWTYSDKEQTCMCDK